MFVVPAGLGAWIWMRLYRRLSEMIGPSCVWDLLGNTRIYVDRCGLRILYYRCCNTACPTHNGGGYF